MNRLSSLRLFTLPLPGVVGAQDARGFCAMAFNPSGTRLAFVAMDNYHTVYVYDWRKKRELSSGRGQMGDPPQVRVGGKGRGW